MYRIIICFILSTVFYGNMEAQCLDVDRNVTQPTCGMEDGMIELTPQNGVPPYTYEYNGMTFQSMGAYTLTNLAIGFYSILITDAVGCSRTRTAILTQDDFQADAFTQLTVCQGGCVEMFAASSGGCLPYTFEWSGPNGYSAIGDTPLACDPGNYIVTVTDCMGCQSIVSNITVSSTSSTFDIDFSTENAACSGDCEGAIDLTIDGGIPPFQFAWSNGETTEDISGLCAGVYEVTVTQDNGLGCVKETSITIVEPSFEIDIVNVESTLCGNCGGSIDIEINGGVAPYMYIWSDNQVTQDISNLCAGDYIVTVTDANSCESIAMIAVEENAQDPFAISILNVENTICGNCEGAIDIQIDGGVPPFSYLWNNNETTEDISGLCEGDYFVTVTDANLCEVFASIPVEADAQDPFSISLFDFQICEGDCFVAEPEIVGAAAGLIFSWSDESGNVFANTQSVTLCTPGIYTVDAINPDGCIESATMSLDVVPQLIISAFVEEETTPGSCDGGILVEIFGGQPPYFFQWNTGATTQNLFPACPGEYTVFVSDIIGCIAELNVIVPTSDLEVEMFILDPDCVAECNGEIEAFVQGGTPPYEFIWSDGQIGQVITNLCPGTYSVTVVDALGAIGLADATVVSISTLSFETITTDASCEGGGTLLFNVLQGSGVYNYFVNGFQVGINTATDLAQGEVIAEVIDLTTGCTAQQIVTIGGPFDVVINTTLASCDTPDGTATAIIPGGTSTYSYLWSNGDTNATATGLAIGGYSVTVTDNDNDCESHANVIIEEESNCFVTIQGYVIVDTDMDCTSDVNSDSIPNILISLNNTEFTYTDQNGFYEFQTDPGTYTLAYESENILYNSICTNPITATVDNFGDISTDNNFYVDENDITDLRLNITKTIIRPGFDHYVHSNVFNFGNQIVSGTYTMVHDENQDFIFAQPPATNYDAATRTITWDYNNLDPLETFLFLAKFNLDPSVSLGTNIVVEGNVESSISDFDLSNNTDICETEVVGSYDPNDKNVTHDGDVNDTDPNLIWPGSTDELTYRIRFQNTGTDTAFTVVIEDELDPSIDIREITPGPSSHPYDLDVRDGNTLVFTFNNILLPDSTTNEQASHGFVFFDLDVSTIQPGTTILNDAAIFFDFNAPIITNEVMSTFDFWLSVDEIESLNDLQVLPNPAQDATNLLLDLTNSANISVQLLDITGKVIQPIQINQQMSTGINNIEINTATIENGTYFLQINVDNQLTSRKLVVIH